MIFRARRLAVGEKCAAPVGRGRYQAERLQRRHEACESPKCGKSAITLGQ